MGHRITIILDDDVMKTLRKIQSDMIKKSEKSVSFSRTVNDVIRQSMKK